MSEEPRSNVFRPRVTVVCLILLAGTIALFFPVKDYPFIGYDDPFYVVDNIHVQAGLTWDSLQWAFSSLTSGFTYWHPLSWVSHMLDCQFFGLNSGRHHLMNVLYHSADVLLLFFVLQKLTRSFWRSAAVAALFAWHPLQVESVAWVTERKNLLSTLFLLLTILFYSRYVEKQRKQNPPGNPRSPFSTPEYWIPVVFFACGLMSKPMLVTVPAVLLLLDFWPLQRLSGTAGDSSETSNVSTPVFAFDKSVLIQLVIEKIPFAILSCISAGITVLSHHEFQSLASKEIPFRTCVENALLSYVRYIKKMFWPNDLAVVYPFPATWPVSRFLVCVLILIAITAAAIVLARKRKTFFLFGWLWFLITLLPVIGLIQAGSQAMADRFAYVPLIGLFIILVWGIAEILKTLRIEKMAAPALAALVLIPCLAASRHQLGFWQNSVTLFEHSVAIEPASPIAQYNLGYALLMHNEPAKAKEHFAQAAKISSTYFDARNNLAVILDREGKTEAAIAEYESFLKDNPRHAQAHCNAAILLEKQHKREEAMAHYRAAVEGEPNNAEAHNSLGNALAQAGKMNEAGDQFLAAVRLDPKSAQAHFNVGNLMLMQNKAKEAIEHFSEAVRLKPDFAQAHFTLGNALAQSGQMEPALKEFVAAAKYKPDVPEIFFSIAMVFDQIGRLNEAVKAYGEALRVKPDFLPALLKLGWIFSAHPDPKLRNGPQAVQIAERAVQLTGEQNFEALDVLGAAYAETGKFAEAAVAAQKAAALAEANGQSALVGQMHTRLELYKQERSFRLQ